LTIEVLPAPLGPMIENSSPSLTPKLTSVNSRTPPRRSDTPRTFKECYTHCSLESVFRQACLPAGLQAFVGLDSKVNFGFCETEYAWSNPGTLGALLAFRSTRFIVSGQPVHRKQPVNGQACRRADPPGIGQHWTDQV
jgi:hypothetical protein